MNRTAHPFLQLLAMLAISFGLVGVFSVLIPVAAAVGIDVSSPGNMLVMQAISQLLSFVLPVVLLVWLFHRAEWRGFLRLDFSRGKWLFALGGLAAWVLMMPLMDWSGVWNDGWHLPESLRVLEDMLRKIGELAQAALERLLGGTGVGRLMSNLLVIALIPALCEEIFFRAGMQNLMLRWLKNPHVAIWLTAAVFSLFHGEVFAFVPRFLMGAILGYLYFGSNSLLPNMLAHFLNNATVVVAYWLSARGAIDVDLEAPLALPWPVTLGCTVAAVAILCFCCGKNLKISR
ncbi:MAG: CPBP family intramembrane metalloprotease [Bacteroidales bacterium]|nr:CPBP family intramembrane metalloprotease [Bacteroidales bacterium]